MKIREGVLARDLEAKGWNGRDLAHHAGIGRATIYRFLGGSIRTPKTLKKIADALEQPTERYLR
jgi:transcriptional regulator with XRE-family HTH domain